MLTQNDKPIKLFPATTRVEQAVAMSLWHGFMQARIRLEVTDSIPLLETTTNLDGYVPLFMLTLYEALAANDRTNKVLSEELLNIVAKGGEQIFLDFHHSTAWPSVHRAMRNIFGPLIRDMFATTA